MIRTRGLAVALLGLVGCESGTAAEVEIQVTDGVALSFDAQTPGVVVTDVGMGADPVARLCGARLEPITVYRDFGFGCIGDRKGTTERVYAWVQPIPATWNASGFCDLPAFFDGPLSLTEEITGPADDSTANDSGLPLVTVPGLAPAPDDAWAVGSTVEEWHGASLCGGLLRGEPVVVSAP